MARVSFAMLSLGAALATEETTASLRGSAAARRLESCTADAKPCAAPHSNSAIQLPAALPATVPAQRLGWRLLERSRQRSAGGGGSACIEAWREGGPLKDVKNPARQCFTP
ncbi:unnamed protein product [Prorocentrum cordatum]|uniref:Uncharacterized protein n=1 Tax=Prorocentrum cordatum TaxID=2364126 RepID=A0ABN9RTK1_9DINO|nr:unnamed protein product [Polarella glacialis]